MLKFIKQNVDTIDGISIYPIISLLVFVLFFIAVIWYVKKMDKSKVEKMRHLPLDLVEENDINPQLNQCS